MSKSKKNRHNRNYQDSYEPGDILSEMLDEDYSDYEPANAAEAAEMYQRAARESEPSPPPAHPLVDDSEEDEPKNGESIFTKLLTVLGGGFSFLKKSIFVLPKKLFGVFGGLFTVLKLIPGKITSFLPKKKAEDPELAALTANRNSTDDFLNPQSGATSGSTLVDGFDETVPAGSGLKSQIVIVLVILAIALGGYSAYKVFKGATKNKTPHDEEVAINDDPKSETDVKIDEPPVPTANNNTVVPDLRAIIAPQPEVEASNPPIVYGFEPNDVAIPRIDDIEIPGMATSPVPEPPTHAINPNHELLIPDIPPVAPPEPITLVTTESMDYLDPGEYEYSATDIANNNRELVPIVVENNAPLPPVNPNAVAQENVRPSLNEYEELSANDRMSVPIRSQIDIATGAETQAEQPMRFDSPKTTDRILAASSDPKPVLPISPELLSVSVPEIPAETRVPVSFENLAPERTPPPEPESEPVHYSRMVPPEAKPSEIFVKYGDTDPTKMNVPALNETIASGENSARRSIVPFDASKGSTSGYAVTANGETLYVLRNDEGYLGVSEKFYGTCLYYKALAEYNRNDIPYPNQMRAGTQVKVPALNVLQREYSAFCPESLEDGTLHASRRARVFDSGSDRDFVLRRFNATLSKSEIEKPELVPGELYIVQEGDTIFRIAKTRLKQLERWIEIYRLNANLITRENFELQPGMRLQLPGI